MKITGPGSGLPPDATAGGPEAEGTASAGKEFTSRLDRTSNASGPERTTAVGGTDAARGSAAVSPVADLGAELQAGRLSPEAAIGQVIERIIDRQVGTNAPPAVREQIGAALRDALETDPLLAEKVRSLSGR